MTKEDIVGEVLKQLYRTGGWALLVIVGLLLAFGWGLYNFGPSWLDRKFKKQLADAEQAFQQQIAITNHLNTKEIERTKAELILKTDRSTKIYDKEFEVLPLLWQKVVKATSDLSHLTAVFRTVPDLDRMNEEQIKEWVAKNQFSELENKQILSAHDKRKAFMDVQFYYELNQAYKSYWNLNAYLQENGIFVRRELVDQIYDIKNLIWGILIDREVSNDAEDFKKWSESNTRVKNELTPAFDDLRERIRKELRREQDANPSETEER